MNKLKILVVIPFFNRTSTICETLNSVASQNLRPDRVVIVDDGSTDGGDIIVQDWINNSTGLSIDFIRTKNRGASAARNIGLQRRSDDFSLIAFLDSDDVWPQDFLARTCEALAKNPGAVAASSDRQFIHIPDGRETYFSLERLPANPWIWILKNGAGIGSCTLFRISAIEAAGGYPEDIPTGHDIVLMGRVAQSGSWLHTAGKPTKFKRFHHPGKKATEWHLHTKYPDHVIRWAKAAHQLWLEAPKIVQLNPIIKTTLSQRWMSAAENAWELGDLKRTIECIKQSIRLRPASSRNLLRLLKLPFRRAK